MLTVEETFQANLTKAENAARALCKDAHKTYASVQLRYSRDAQDQILYVKWFMPIHDGRFVYISEHDSFDAALADVIEQIQQARKAEPCQPQA